MHHFPQFLICRMISWQSKTPVWTPHLLVSASVIYPDHIRQLGHLTDIPENYYTNLTELKWTQWLYNQCSQNVFWKVMLSEYSVKQKDSYTQCLKKLEQNKHIKALKSTQTLNKYKWQNRHSHFGGCAKGRPHHLSLSLALLQSFDSLFFMFTLRVRGKLKDKFLLWSWINCNV